MVAQALILLLVLALPLAALIARRLPMQTMLIYGAAWVAVFTIGWLIVARFT